MRKNFGFVSSLLMFFFMVTVSGCRHDEEQKDFQKEREEYLKQFQPEIKRKERVRGAVKNAVATSADPKVLAFHEFLTHWNLRWPVVKEGAFGEGGIGFAWYDNLQKFQGNIDATAIIENRYVLQAILDCDVSKDCSEIIFTKLRFSFGEVKEVRLQPGGGADIRFNTQNDKWFGLKEWDQLKESNWDFSKIGITIISNAPIPNIQTAFE